MLYSLKLNFYQSNIVMSHITSHIIGIPRWVKFSFFNEPYFLLIWIHMYEYEYEYNYSNNSYHYSNQTTLTKILVMCRNIDTRYLIWNIDHSDHTESRIGTEIFKLFKYHTPVFYCSNRMFRVPKECHLQEIDQNNTVYNDSRRQNGEQSLCQDTLN